MKWSDFRGDVIDQSHDKQDYFYEDYKVGVKEEDYYSGGVEFFIPLHILLSVIDQIQEKGKVDWRSPVKIRNIWNGNWRTSRLRKR